MAEPGRLAALRRRTAVFEWGHAYRNRVCRCPDPPQAGGMWWFCGVRSAGTHVRETRVCSRRRVDLARGAEQRDSCGLVILGVVAIGIEHGEAGLQADSLVVIDSAWAGLLSRPFRSIQLPDLPAAHA